MISDGKVPVWWRPCDDGAPGKNYWDQSMLADLLHGELWQARGWVYEDVYPRELIRTGGGVVIVPGAHSDPAEVALDLADLEWAVVIVTSDEERRFDVDKIRGPRRSIWLQYPQRGDVADTRLPVGYGPGTHEWARDHPTRGKTARWNFNGQTTTHPRMQARRAFRRVPGGVWNGTSGFAQGIPRPAYLEQLAGAHFAPAPGGPISPDSFRTWEALAVGTVPITDHAQWWSWAMGQTPPWPFAGVDWRAMVPTVRAAETDPTLRPLVAAWWTRMRRFLAQTLDLDVARMAGTAIPNAGRVQDLVTVVITTSPIPSHPSTAILDATMQSLGAAGLEGCECVLAFDGVRDIQAGRGDAYWGYVDAVTARCNEVWRDRVVPIVHRTHQHQARLTRDALGVVRTPLILFVEHDTPLVGPIPWDRLTKPLMAGQADVVRLYHEKVLQAAHADLVTDELTTPGFVRTHQWSQRPHLARTDYYRRALHQHFNPDERWMIEDRMHSVAQTEPSRNRIWLYTEEAPGWGIQRSAHLDGRGSDPKWVDS